MARELSIEELALKQELLEMVPMKLPVEHPLVVDWLERATNVLGKDQLKPGQRWVLDATIDEMVIVNVN